MAQDKNRPQQCAGCRHIMGTSWIDTRLLKGVWVSPICIAGKDCDDAGLQFRGDMSSTGTITKRVR